MNEPNFDEFLLGVADDQKHRTCEDLLSNPETIVSFQSTLADDSLISALRMSGDSIHDSQDLELLAKQVENLVPRHSITADELNRFLDPPEFPDELGKIGRFRIVEFLASGGMGLVFRAVDPDLDREVCVKLLSPSLEFNAEAKSRFEKESREASRMGSERIVTVLEVGRQRGLPYFVMPMLEGMSLRSMLDKQLRVPPERAIQITRQLAEGLQYAHDRQLLHRDIKPDNIWLTTTGDVVILDFGLVRSTDDSTENEAPITRQGTVIGTPSYMSPEQVTGKELDQRSDLFSVGVVLVEMLTGESPFKKANLFSTMMSVAGDEIQMEQIELMREVPIGLRELAQHLLQKNPGNRIESAARLIQTLDQIEASPHSSLAGTSTSRKDGGSWKKLVAAGLMGVLLSMLPLAVWIANDKGTLVVSTNDPSVEVRIADQEVTIHDPVSDRTYQIRIGETPLPSGVYQLETESENGELKFSSQTIAIRRGEKTIVTVELVASKPAITNSKPPLEVTAEAAWADTSRVAEAYVADTRVALIDRIRRLPSISLKEAGFDTAPALVDRATVQQPRDLEPIGAWTVERLVGSELNISPNCDQTLFAGIPQDTSTADGFVRIFDQSREIKTALPIPGQISRVSWSGHANDMIAVSSWVRGFDINASNYYAITVWQITDTGARLIRSVRASDRSFNWDKGYRIVCFINSTLSALQLDTGLVWTMPEAAGGEYLHDSAISSDGQYVATYSLPSDNAQISIWDLKSGRFLMAIPSGIGFQWGSDSQRIAVDVRRLFGRGRAEENALEIWDIASRQMTQSFPKANMKKSCISPDLRTFANELKSGRIVFTDTSTRREQSFQPSSEFINKEKSRGDFSFRWTPQNRLKIWNSKFTTVLSRSRSGVDGQFSPVVANTENRWPQPNRFELTDLRLTAADELVVFGRKDRFVDEYEGFGLRINLADHTVNRNASFSDLKWPKRRRGYNYFTIRAKMVSPSGRFVLTWGSSTIDNYSSNSKNLRVIDLDNPDRVLPIMNLEWISETAWSNDESLLIVSGREWYKRGSRQNSKVIDLTRWSERVVEGLPTESATHFQEWNGGFVCSVHTILKKRPRVSEQKVGYFAIQEDAKFQTVDVGFNSIQSLGFNGPNVVFSGRRFNELEQKTPSSLPMLNFELSPDLKLTEKPHHSFSGKSPSAKNHSFDGKYLIQEGLAESQKKPSWNSPNCSIFRVDNRGEQDSKTETSVWNGPVKEFRWHPNSNSALWQDPEGSWCFFDAERTPKPRRFSGKIKVATPIEGGWLVLMQERMRQVDFDGRVIAELSFDQDDTGGPVNPVWVFADGSVVGNVKPLHMIYDASSEIRVDKPSEFLRKFPDATLPGSNPVRLRLPQLQGR